MALSSGRRSRGSQNDESVALRDGSETRDVRGRTVVGRRPLSRRRRLADSPHEPLELHRCEAHQRANRLGTAANEGMWHALGQLFVGLRPVASDAIEVTLDMHSTGKPPQRHAGTQMSPVHIGLTADLIAQSDLKQVNAAQPHCPFDAGIVGKSV
jgi:hypothetical protein